MLIKQVLAQPRPLEASFQPGISLGGTSTTISTIVNPLLSNVLIITGIIALFTILFSGFSYITAGGDKNKLQNATNMLNYSIIGLVVIAISFFLSRIILGFTGIQSLPLLNEI